MRRCASGALLLCGGPGRSPWAASRSGRYDPPMPERPRKRPADLNRLAASIVESATLEKRPGSPPVEPRTDTTDAHAEAGRLGGLKGGKVRAEKLPAERRSEIAKNAARARWAGRSS